MAHRERERERETERADQGGDAVFEVGAEHGPERERALTRMKRHTYTRELTRMVMAYLRPVLSMAQSGPDRESDQEQEQ